MEVAMAYNRDNTNGDQITIPFQTDEKKVAEAVADLFSALPPEGCEKKRNSEINLKSEA